MPKYNHINLGEVLSYSYKEGIIQELYFENEATPSERWDYAKVNVDEQIGVIPIFYHCQAPSLNTERENGAITDCSSGFSVGDKVIVRCRIEDGMEELYQVVGHVDGPHKCQCCIGIIEVDTITCWESDGMDWDGIEDRVECKYLEALRLCLIEKCKSAKIGYGSMETTIAPYLDPSESSAWFSAFVVLRNSALIHYIIHTIQYENKEEFEFWTLAKLLEVLGEEDVAIPRCGNMAAWVKLQYKILNMLRELETDQIVITPIRSVSHTEAGCDRTGIFTVSPSWGWSESTYYDEEGNRVYIQNEGTRKPSPCLYFDVRNFLEFQSYDFRENKLEVRSPDEGNGSGNVVGAHYDKQFNFGNNGVSQFVFAEYSHLERWSIEFKLSGTFGLAADFEFYYKYGSYIDQTGEDEINLNYKGWYPLLWRDPIDHSKIIYRRRISPYPEDVLVSSGINCSVGLSEDVQEVEFKDLFPDAEDYTEVPVTPPSAKGQFDYDSSGDDSYWTIRESYGGINRINIDVKGIEKPRFNFRNW